MKRDAEIERLRDWEIEELRDFRGFKRARERDWKVLGLIGF